MSSLLKRTLSALVLFPLIIIALWMGGWFAKVLLGAVLILSLLEWFFMCLQADTTAFKRNVWFFFGVIYILVACWGFYQLRFLSGQLGFPEASLQLLLIVIISLTDTFAYFVGKTLGGPKLAPAISPNKTVSGSLGGLIAAVFFTSILLILSDFPLQASQDFYILFIGVTACVSIIGQIGDLFESYVKRQFSLKDSGNLIPGHGGILDRSDSLLAVSFIVGLGCLFLLF